MAAKTGEIESGSERGKYGLGNEGCRRREKELRDPALKVKIHSWLILGESGVLLQSNHLTGTPILLTDDFQFGMGG